MKTLLYGIITSFMIMLSAYSDDNNTSTNLSNVNSTNKLVTIQSTLNDVVIDILRGAKTASSEVYSASKSAVIASIDFAKEQVPDVVDQFIRWKLFETIVNIVGWIIFVIFVLYISKKITQWTDKFREKHPDELHHYRDITYYEVGMTGKWVTRIIAIVIIVTNVWGNGMIISKILVAPKVFLIEYVVDTINKSTPPKN